MEFGDESNSRSIGPLTIIVEQNGLAEISNQALVTWRRIRGWVRKDYKNVKGISFSESLSVWTRVMAFSVFGKITG